MASSPQRDAYFVRLDDGRYQPTEFAGGAWREDELHLAPVAGLMVHVMEQWRLEHLGEGLVFSRFSFEALGQIPREPIDVSVEVVRPGRTIELIEATAVISGRVTLRARAWLLQRADTEDIAGHEFEPLPSPHELTTPSTLRDWGGGFCLSVRAFETELKRPGRGQAWVTSELDLVANETTTPLAHYCRLLDSANGIAVREQPDQWMFPNVDLTLHFFRQPHGEWVGFDTRVAFGPDGVGLTSSVIHDLDGTVGTVQQSLTVRKL